MTNTSDIRPISTGKVRFDVEVLGQAKDLDNLTIPLTSTSSIYWSSAAHHFRQQRLQDYSLDTSPKRRMGTIRGRDALNILETYHERYRIRCGGNDVFLT